MTLPNLDKLGMDRVLNPAREVAVSAAVGARMNVRWASPEAPAQSLSGGNQQKLLVARWILAQSRCMIFDEPTRGIDVGAKREIYLLLDALAREGKAILFISSELPELFGVADRILVMRRGQTRGQPCDQGNDAQRSHAAGGGRVKTAPSDQFRLLDLARAARTRGVPSAASGYSKIRPSKLRMTTRSLLRLRTYPGLIGHFAAAAGRVNNILRHGVAAGVPAQAFHDFQPLAHAGPQMGRAGDQVALIDVIRLDPAHQQFLHLRPHRPPGRR